MWVTTFDIETRNIHGHIVGAAAHMLEYSITVRRNATSRALLGGLESDQNSPQLLRREGHRRREMRGQTELL